MYTNNIQKEEFSIAYAHAVAALAKCNVGNWHIDGDSVDISLRASVPGGKQTIYPQLDVQLKCTDADIFHKEGLSFSLKIKNYNDLRARVLNQRLLVVVCVPEGDANWAEQSQEQLSLKKCGYWLAPSQFPDSDNKASVTVKIPYDNIFSVDNLIQMMSVIADGGVL
jgi:hypothetical protein